VSSEYLCPIRLTGLINEPEYRTCFVGDALAIHCLDGSNRFLKDDGDNANEGHPQPTIKGSDRNFSVSERLRKEDVFLKTCDLNYGYGIRSLIDFML